VTPFTTLAGIAAPLPFANIDTDALMPKQFLKTVRRTGLGRNLFWDLRYHEDGAERGDFILNKGLYRGARILIAGANFGCGSSREHAPWGLLDFGIRCIIAPSFADIFAGNCVKNGILCITLPAASVSKLADMAADPTRAWMTVDLAGQTITAADHAVFAFSVDPARKETLLGGLDDIDLTLRDEDAITRFEQARIWREPWRSAASAAHE